ncbi:MAG: hypothetical protein JXR76_17135 [Deltaproteobacteria bacterium]|nr:hypothetical protein [Deltaproteobacteria bacterium]
MKLLLLIVCISFLFQTTAILADDSEAEAKIHFREAKNLFEAGQYEAAAVEFREAYRLNPTWKLLFNIGQMEAAAKNYGLAYEAFELYLVEGGDDVSEQRQQEIQKELARLRPLVGTLQITAQNGAEVTVDGMPRGKTPEASNVKVSAGKLHHIVVRLNGAIIVEKQLKVSGQEIRRLATDDAASTASSSAAPETVADGSEETPSSSDGAAGIEKSSASGPVHSAAFYDRRQKAKKMRIAGWVTLISGGAMLAGAAVTGGMALSTNSKLKDSKSCDADNRCLPGAYEDVDKLNTLNIASTILLSVGGAAVATGVVLLLMSKKKKDKLTQAGKSNWRLIPGVGTDAAYLGLTGRF